jgi:glycogen debranching enzyme
MQETKPRQTTWLIIWVLSVLLGTVGYFFWRIGSYGRRLWRQPLLMSLPLPALAEDDEVLEARAVLIASTNLRGGIEKRLLLDGREKFVLCAGRRNFREPWARDLSFASFGLIELDEWQAARESLEVFLINQKPTGQFPVKIHSTTIMDRYLHSLFSREQPIHAPLKPKYVTAHKTISLDGNALLVIAILNYTLRSGDHDFARRHWLPLKQALSWVEGHALEEDGFLHQSVFADWADSFGRA